MFPPVATETAAPAASGRRNQTPPTARGQIIRVRNSRGGESRIVIVTCAHCGARHSHTGLGARRAGCGARYVVVAGSAAEAVTAWDA